MPHEVLSAWNADPALIAMIVLLTFAALVAVTTRSQKLLMASAAAVCLVAFVSPLCALSSALFSARVFHHILLVAVAAPLVAFAARSALRPAPAGSGLTLPFVVHAAVLWLWHAPAPYAWALSGDAAYWTMELTLAGTAVWLWLEVFRPGRRTAAAAAVLAATAGQMGLLGALITFARHPLYGAHALTTEPFGLSAMQDQQLAGLIMWVPGAAPYMLVALGMVAAMLRPRAVA